MSTADEDAWRATLVGGAVAIVAVAGLLEALRRSVVRVDERVDALWQAGQQLAGNTAQIHLLTDTRRLAGQIADAVDGDRPSPGEKP